MTDFISPSSVVSSRTPRRFGLRKVALVLVAVAATLCMAAAAATQVIVPQAVLASSELNLGAGTPGQVMDGKLLLKNSGWRQLQFSVSGSCSCTSLEPKEGTLSPGEEVPIPVGLRLQRYSASREQVRVTVKSNDPDEPELECSVFATCPAPVSVEPGLLTFTIADERNDLPPPQVVRLKALSDEWKGSLDQVQTKFRSDLLAIAAQPAGPELLELTVRLEKPPSAAEVYETVEIHHPSSQHVIPLSIKICRLDAVHVAPSVVYLPAVSSTASSTGTGAPREQRLLVWHEERDRLISQIETVSSPEGIHVEIVPPPESSRDRFRAVMLGFGENVLGNKPEDVLRLRVDGRHELSIRVVRSAMK